MHTPLKIFLDNINEAYYILGCKCALPQKVAYGAGHTTPAKGGKNTYGSEKGKEKEEIRTETVLGFLLSPGPLPHAGLFFVVLTQLAAIRGGWKGGALQAADEPSKLSS